MLYDGELDHQHANLENEVTNTRRDLTTARHAIVELDDALTALRAEHAAFKRHAAANLAGLNELATDRNDSPITGVKLSRELTDALYKFEPCQSDDDVKRDLELTCRGCGEVLCDIEPGDDFDVLVRMALEHECGARETPASTAAREKKQ